MLELLIVLTVLEVVVVLVVLVTYLILVLRSLRKATGYAAKIAFGVRAIETQVRHVGPAIASTNSTLAEIAEALPPIAERAERAAAR